MRRIVELFLKGKGKVELESKVLDQFGLEVTYNINDIVDVGSRKTNYSKSFSIIGTQKNNILFEHIYDINFTDNTFDMNAKQECYLTVNNNIVMDGYLKLRSIEKTYIAGKYQVVYNVNIYDEVKDIFTEFSEKSLKDLNFSKSFTFMNDNYAKGDHVFSLTNIKNSQSRLKSYKNTYEYAIINWNYNGINEGEKWPTPMGFTLSQFYPSIYVKAVIDKMFKDIGYTYESDFLNGLTYNGIFPTLATIYNESNMLTSETKYYSHICPAGGQSFEYKYGVVDQPDGPVQPDTDDPKASVRVTTTTSYQTDYISTWDQGIKIKGDGNYTFEGDITMKWLTISSGATEANDALQFRNQDGDVILEYIFDTEILDIPIHIKFDPIDLKTGDILYAWYKCGYSLEPYNYLGHVARWYDYKMNVSIQNNTDIVDKVGTEISLSDFLPNITQANFLKSLIKQFNLYIYPVQNKEKHILIEPKKTFYNKGKILDWTKKVVDDTLIIEPMGKKISRYYNFKMGIIDTLKTRKYYDKWKSNYGNKEIDLVNDNTQGTNNIESIFGGYDFQYFKTNNGADYIVIPNFTKEITDNNSTQKREIAPSIGFINNRSSIGYTWGFVEDGVTINKWNTICHIERFGTIKQPYDLNFETKQGLPATTVNSYMNFWQDSMNNIFNNNNRIITYYVDLNIIDIKNLDFKNVILIKGELYYIENVVVDLNSDKPSKLELIKAFDYLKYVVPVDSPILWGLVDTSGVIASGAGRPIASEALLDTGFKYVKNSESFFNLSPDSSLENYFWFATPNESLLNKKNSWAVNEYNKGSIGGEVNLGGNLFPDPELIDYNGVSYNVYIANYQTFIDVIKLDYEESTNN